MQRSNTAMETHISLKTSSIIVLTRTQTLWTPLVLRILGTPENGGLAADQTDLANYKEIIMMLTGGLF